MGNWWSRTPASQTYERILSDIDEKIRGEESFLIDLRLNDRRYSVLILLYGLLLYGALLGWIIFMHPKEERTIWDVVWVLGFPVIILQLRKLLGAIYGRRIGAGEERLKLLRERQRMKVEELKRMTDYYNTKGLIDRFEHSPSERKKGLGLDEQINRQTGVVMRNQVKQPPAALPALLPSLPLLPPPPAQAAMHSVGWFDRLVDTIIGDDRGSRYALICPRCHAHNGLVREHELSTISYICPNCHFHIGKTSGTANVAETASEKASSEKSMTQSEKTPSEKDSQSYKSTSETHSSKVEKVSSVETLNQTAEEGSFVSTSKSSPSSSTTPKQRRVGGRRKSVNNSPLGK